VDGSAQSISNRFRQLVADFVVCAPDFTAVAVIELDDRSHARKVQRERDQRKDRFLQEAGIKVIRVSVADMPNEAALKTLVAVMPLTSAPTLLRAAHRAIELASDSTNARKSVLCTLHKPRSANSGLDS